MSTTNLYQLTISHRAAQAKKRAQTKRINQVIFDEDARRLLVFNSSYHILNVSWCREFLTGFHKRKVVRTEAARAKAKQKEKADRLEARREVNFHRT